MSVKTPTYRAWYRKDPKWVNPPTDRLRELLIYDKKPNGNLIGELPYGTMPKPRDAMGNSEGTFYRTDGGDPFERAIFTTRNGVDIVVERST